MIATRVRRQTLPVLCWLLLCSSGGRRSTVSRHSLVAGGLVCTAARVFSIGSTRAWPEAHSSPACRAGNLAELWVSSAAAWRWTRLCAVALVRRGVWLSLAALSVLD